MAGLKEWFKQDWVDIGAKKKGGGFKKCGRKSASGSKRKYPKCVPAAKSSKHDRLRDGVPLQGKEVKHKVLVENQLTLKHLQKEKIWVWED